MPPAANRPRPIAIELNAVLVALVDGVGANAREVAASARLGHRYSQDLLAADRRWQEALLLLLGAQRAEVGRDEP